MMNSVNNKRICPVELANGLDNSIRRIIQNPRRLLEPYIRTRMTVLDLGCGPGFFSIEIAKLVGNSGKVIAADLQEGMLEIIKRKIQGTTIEKSIKLHLCEADKIGVAEKVDFVLLFYMVHEVPSQEKLFSELESILKPGGKIFIVEPAFHVSKREFNDMIAKITDLNFEIIKIPKMFFNRCLLIMKKDSV